VFDSLLGLRHDAVVGGHHEDDDVRHLRASGAHLGERLVARRVDERDPLVPDGRLIRTNVLRYSTGLAGLHAGLADAV